MKKFILMIVALFTMTMSMNAQQTTVEGSRFFDNTYMGISIGGQTGMKDVIGHNNWTVAPTGSLYFGKWLTPIFALEVDGDVLLHDGFSTRNTFVDATYVGMNARFNLNNIFHVYRGTPDNVEVIPFIGFGWLHAYGNGEYTSHNLPTVSYVGKNAFATKMGIDVNIYLNKVKSWAFNVRPTVEYALTGGAVNGTFPRYNSHNGRIGLEVGLTYNFGHKNSKGVSTHHFTKAYTVNEYDTMVELLSNQTPDTVYVVKEIQVETPAQITVEEKVEVKDKYIIPAPYFARAKYNLDPTADVILNMVANEMKSNSCPYTITGYASLEGAEAYNQELSLNRAKTVYNALVERGVEPERLTVVGGGATDMFGKIYELNRTVIIEHTNCCK